MNRRQLVAEGFRYLAQVLPGMVATAGGLAVLLRQPAKAAFAPQAACFPADSGKMASPTLTPIPEEE